MPVVRAIVREGMEEGAFGMSTGLDYPPGSYADTAELIELSRESSERFGGRSRNRLRDAKGLDTE